MLYAPSATVAVCQNHTRTIIVGHVMAGDISLSILLPGIALLVKALGGCTDIHARHVADVDTKEGITHIWRLIRTVIQYEIRNNMQ